MQKLVSRNPVQRFKEGKKLEFLRAGGKPWAGYYTVGNWPKSGSTTPVKKNSVLTGLQLKLWNNGFFKNVKDRRGNAASYESAVDGAMSEMTRQAIEAARAAGYEVDEKTGIFKKPVQQQASTQQKPQQVKKQTRFVTTSGASAPPQIIEQAATAVKSHVEEAGDFVAHNPAAILIEDMSRATLNRMIEAITGKRPFGGRTITSLPTLQQQELINQVKFAKSQGVDYFNSDMYKKMYQYNYGSRNGQEGEDRTGLWARMNSPRARIEHTLGQYKFYTDENGNTIVTDVYDFNDDQKQGGEGRYVNVRNNIAATYGSRSSEPDKGKIKYKINLGKL